MALLRQFNRQLVVDVGSAGRSRGRNLFPVVRGVDLEGIGDLAEISVHTDDARLHPGPVLGRQQDRDEQRDDCHNDEQFDQCKRRDTSAVTVGIVSARSRTGHCVACRSLWTLVTPEASDKPPIVCVIRRSESDADSAAFVYRVTDRLRGILAGITPDRLEAISREIAGHRVEEIFDVRPMTEQERQNVKRP